MGFAEWLLVCLAGLASVIGLAVLAMWALLRQVDAEDDWR